MMDDIFVKAQELVDSLDISNVEWGEWETDFIESIQRNVEHRYAFSTRQEQKVLELWERL